MKQETPIRDFVANFLALVSAVYLCGYSVVRFTHTKHWFDKTMEETGSYTFFDTWSRRDGLLYTLFYPMLVLDSKILGRPFEQDYW
jgi:hypothetical protein